MLRKTLAIVMVMGVLAASFTAVPYRAAAQTGPDGFTLYELHLRAGPGASYAVIATLPTNVGFIFEARNADMSWLLGHTEDGALRGWVASLYLRYREGFAAMRLPVSEEVVSYQAPAAPAQAPANAGAPPAGAPVAAGLPPGGLAPNLEAIPIVPTITANARTIFQRGQALGNNPHVVTKVGECNSMSYAFLNPFNGGQYDLGQYGSLQRVISGTTFVNPSLATGAGFTAETEIDASFGNPAQCPGLSPLECEYQRSKPSVAFIMLGMHDIYFLSAPEYEQAIRRIIEISIADGVIPVLTTFPVWPDGDVRTTNRFAFDTILVNLAREYDVPLMNFWLASQSVQHSGVGVDHVHITEVGNNWTSFNGDQFQYGMTMWNLVALQTLDQIQQSVMN